jgi:hypothetical protein
MPYIKYGLKNELSIWKIFKQDMLTSANDLWISTGNNAALPARDLGYFVGYAICRSYYNTSKNKPQAITDIINLDYTKQDAVLAFLERSGYEKYLVAKGYNTASKQLKKEGYTSNITQITFTFSPLDKPVIIDENGNNIVYDTKKMGPINAISIAGDFNEWNYNLPAFQLVKNKNGKFTLSIDKDKLGMQGQQVKFKFVINNKYWVVPKFAISNRITDKEGNTNLYIQL